MSKFEDDLEKIAKSVEVESRIAREKFNRAWETLRHGCLLPRMEAVRKSLYGFEIINDGQNENDGQNLESVEFGAYRDYSGSPLHTLTFSPIFEERVIEVTSSLSVPRSRQFRQLSDQKAEDIIKRFVEPAAKAIA